LNINWCDPSFTKKIIIPKNLALEKNKLFLDTIKERLLPSEKRTVMDSSLKWLISGELNKSRLKTHPFFNLIVSPKTNWQSTISLPKRYYYMDISGDTLQRLYHNTCGNNFLTCENDSVTKNDKGFLINNIPGNYIHNYFNGRRRKTLDEIISPITQNKEYQVYKIYHTVFVKKDDRYKWVFISDNNVTALLSDRHRISIREIKLIDNYLIIIQQGFPYDASIQIVNIETQRVGRMHYCPDSYLQIIDDVLTFTDENYPEEIKIPLKDIFKALDEF